ncbi:MAG TPA: NAD(P)/FAD-dependent oxidoreductase [Burkholderiales bacterium]|nr:NAD(P)/FAD-dependent oxidoreductase [Burkholderiales bacterium]
MSEARSADVVVLGLGPAGASAAAEAARRGCRVIALDRKREPGVPVQCAEFVPAMLGTQVKGLGCTVRQPIEAMATFVEDESPDLKPDFPGHMLDRAAFDAALVAEALRAGADCRFGAVVKRVSRAGEVELSTGEAFRCRVMIGADGPRSLAGRAIRRVNTQVVETRQVTVPLLAPHAATDIFLSAGIPGGYGWLFPKREVANLGAGVIPAEKARLKAIVSRLHARLVDEGRVGPQILSTTGGAIPVGGMVQPVGRLDETLVLLAGDAAGLANPVTGAGIAAAVHSGRLAGESASQAVFHPEGSSGAALQYQEALEELFKPSLDRAVRRRAELLQSNPTPLALRRGWIAYPEYWT